MQVQQIQIPTPSGAMETVVARAAELRRPGLAYHDQVHQAAEPGYARPDRDIHDDAATAKDWDAIRAMLRRQLTEGASAAA